MLVFAFLLLMVFSSLLAVYAILFRNELLFYPLREELPDYSKKLSVYSSIQITSGNEQLQSRFYNFSGKSVVLYFHGNSGNMSYYQHVPLLCALLGMDVFMIDYRGFGVSSGTSTLRSVYEDGLAAYDFIRKWYKAKDIVIWGDSLGTTVASYIAAKKQTRSLLMFGGFSGLEDIILSRTVPGLSQVLILFMRYLDIELPTREWFGKIQVPILILHSKEDAIVPFTSSGCLLDLNKNAKRLVVDGGHLSFDMSQGQTKQVCEFLSGRSLKTKEVERIDTVLSKYKEHNPLLA